MIPYLFNNSKEAGGKGCEIWLKLKLRKGMATFPTLQTWIGHNATRYPNLNRLPHALPYIYFLGDLPDFRLFAICYRHFFEKLLIYFFYKFRGNAW